MPNSDDIEDCWNVVSEHTPQQNTLMPCPWPITWWKLVAGCAPVLSKPAGVPAFIIEEDADTILMVTKPNVLHVPIFELHYEEGNSSTQVQERIQELLGGLLDAARLETCTNDTEPKGFFYGLLRSCYKVRSDGPWVEVVELGLAYSEREMTPYLGVEMFEGEVIYEDMSQEACQRIGLPTFLVLPVIEPEVHRPTRFEREDVI